jgi:SAM-dependent methyltransferase
LHVPFSIFSISEVEKRMEAPDPDRLREYLLSFDLFPADPGEGVRYLDDSLRRLLLTLALVPPDGAGLRLLELGAGPYFLTLLLRRFRHYELQLANFYGDGFPAHSSVTVASPRYGERHTFAFRNFNAERDSFPYPDSSFALVLCCEIVEHLLQDPTHMLCEIHRVLAPAAHLLLTTPNVFNLAYGLRLLRGKGNVFHPYSAHGPYGRHQREYTLAEVTDLLRGIGYAVECAHLADIHAYAPHWRLAKRLRPGWRDHLFVLARKAGARCPYYPPSLYQGTPRAYHVTVARRSEV